MKFHLIAAAAVYLTLATTAWAQTAPSTDPAADAAAGNEAVSQSATDEAATGVTAEVEQLKSKVEALIEEAQAGATDIVKEMPGAGALSQKQVVGIAVGIVAGAIVADFFASGGLATLALSAGGGVLGNWVASEL